ncbi:MAG TPA: S-layer homology domain-containing protein [Anaerovoracaceae bacterium]|nr:S-layer homology domain-containing protein [Anaerovoracaceae bacterium]
MKKKWISLILSVSMLIAATPATAAAAGGGDTGNSAAAAAMTAAETVSYADMPSDPAYQWAVDAVNAAGAYGLMQGPGDGTFGFGKSITKAEFITILCRMFGWEPASLAAPAFSDVAEGDWYYTSVETALAHNVVDGTGTFQPNVPITREEMAVMLVRGLGYNTLAQSVAAFGSPFTDVAGNAGYIAIASDIGMTNGITPTTFAPAQTAKREEAAAMLIRVYGKYIDETDWVHGFYAISSYGQKELAKDMDAISLGWSRMNWNADQGAYLNTTSAENNEYNIPQGYEDAVSYFEENQIKAHLSVYMDTSAKAADAAGGSVDVCSAILLDSTQRTKAVSAIVNELTVNYNTIGYNPYSGVTIDFEGMKGDALKQGFSSFLAELSAALKPLGKTLYVTVPPVAPDGQYFNAYDYRAIGDLADKVILMAHDYNETTMPANLLNSEYYRNTPVTPIASVYYGLRGITDENTGVRDLSKVALAISFSSVGWELENGKLASTASVSPATATIYDRLKGGAAMGYSEVYRNPYIEYTTEEGKDIFLWYEDERSVNDKLALAKLFGVTGASFWRLGTIPDYSDEGLYFDIMKGIN